MAVGPSGIPIKLPRTLADLEDLINNKVQESLFLDYKASDALKTPQGRNELSKDVSAFANSSGGVLVYGIKEDKTFPLEIDAGLSLDEMSKEQLESKVLSNIAPRLNGLEIIAIELQNGNFAFVVGVERAFRPYQDRFSHRYYKRFNFKSEPMEDYEIEDIRLRSASFPSLIRISVFVDQGFTELEVENHGNFAASELKFKFDPSIPWNAQNAPAPLINGIQSLAPGRKIRYYVGATRDILDAESKFPTVFTVEVAYVHMGISSKLSENFVVDIAAASQSVAAKSDVTRLKEMLKDEIGKITKELGQLRGSMEKLERVTTDTGLNLSITTIRNLKHLLEFGGKSEKLALATATPAMYREVLGVDFDVAHKIYTGLKFLTPGQSIEDVLSDDPALIAKLHEYFK